MRREKALKRREALQLTRRMAAEAAEKLALKSSEATPPPSDGPPGADPAHAATHHADHPCALRLYTPDEHSASLLTPLPLAAHHQPPPPQSLNPSLIAPSAMPRHEPPLPVAANARAAAWLPARPLELSAPPQELRRRQQQQQLEAQRVSSLPSVAHAECVCPACAPTSLRVLRLLMRPYSPTRTSRIGLCAAARAIGPRKPAERSS